MRSRGGREPAGPGHGGDRRLPRALAATATLCPTKGCEKPPRRPRVPVRAPGGASDTHPERALPGPGCHEKRQSPGRLRVTRPPHATQQGVAVLPPPHISPASGHVGPDSGTCTPRIQPKERPGQNANAHVSGCGESRYVSVAGRGAAVALRDASRATGAAHPDALPSSPPVSARTLTRAVPLPAHRPPPRRAPRPSRPPAAAPVLEPVIATGPRAGCRPRASPQSPSRHVRRAILPPPLSRGRESPASPPRSGRSRPGWCRRWG
jgi:hypothetical protein